MRVFDKVHCFFFLQARVFTSPCVLLTRSIVSSASLSIHQSVRVFDKVHCLFCKLEYSSVRACFWQGPLSLLQAWVFISPCLFSRSSIVHPGLCSVQSAWFSGQFCFLNFCSKSWRKNSYTFWIDTRFTGCWKSLMIVCAVPSVWKKCQNLNLCLVFAKFEPLVSKSAWTIAVTRSEY